MATIGYATLQIIPSLKGVTDAIEKQVEGKVVNVTVEPQVDRRATEQAGRQAKDTVEKHTKQVTVEPKVDQTSARKAGKQAGETVTKEVTDAVRKGDIGKTVGDEVASSSTSSAAKKAAKVLVDGIADGIKSELPQGGIGQVFVDGLADGIKQGIDAGAGGQIATTISEGIRSGNLGGAIRDAVMPAIENIGNDIRSGVSTWAGGIADSLRSGDIKSATDEIGTTVRNTTNLIADIGETFGLQLDGVRDFGNKAGTFIDQFGTDVQDVITKASDVYTKFSDIGTFLDTVLPMKTKNGTAAMSASWLSLIPVIGQVVAAWEFGKTNPFIQPGQVMPDGSRESPPSADGDQSKAVIGPDGNLVIYDKDGKPYRGALNPSDLLGGGGKFQSGGYTGPMPVDKIAGVVHGGEYVIKASSTKAIENAAPGLLDYLNSSGAGFESGGGVPGGGNFNPGVLIDTSRASVYQPRTGIERALSGFSNNLSANGRRLLENLGILQRPGFAPLPSVRNIPGQNTFITGGMFGRGGKVPGYKNGGKVSGITTAEQQSMWDAVRGKFPGAIMSSGTRTFMTEGHADWHNAGRAIDIVGPNMGSIAAWIASTYPNSLELIHHPFSRNIKNGKNVGDGISTFGANTMAQHRNHVHWALGSLAAIADSTDMLAAISPPTSAPATTTPMPETAPSTPSSPSTKLSLASSFSGLSSTGLKDLGISTQVTPDSPVRTLQLGQAAGSAIEGQVASALGVFGINDSPGWLQGLSRIASEITIGGDSATPVAAAPRAVTPPAMTSVHSGSGAQPGPGVVYNINAWDTEAAFQQARQQDNERSAAKLARY